jgi:hypothetical protein
VQKLLLARRKRRHGVGWRLVVVEAPGDQNVLALDIDRE